MCENGEMAGNRLIYLMCCSLMLLCACSAMQDDQERPGNDGEDDTGIPDLPGCQGMDALWEELVATVEGELLAADVPGAALAVVCDGRTAYAATWGTVGGGSNEPILPTTRFQIASTTKMFTAAAAMRLVEEGHVDLQQPVDTYVPYASARGPAGEPITLHQLLSHTAGYPTVFPGADSSSMELAGYFANNADQPTWAPPGEVYNYSNLGMALAGLALEEALGEPFADLVEDRIFEPAGMSRASLHVAEVEEEGDFAYGHSGSAQQSNEVAPTDSYLPSGYYGPMGGAWASVLDLAAWGEVHLSQGGDVLEPSSLSLLSTPWTETRLIPDQHYGYGLFVDDIHGFDRLSHGGSVAGYLSTWLLAPVEGFGVFAVTSCDWYSPGSLAYEALDLFVGLENPDWGDRLSSEEDWPAYEGRYRDPHVLGTIEVGRQGEALVADFQDLGFESELVGSYQDAYRFTYQPTGAPISAVFWRTEPEGDAQYLVTLKGVATRED